MITILLNTLAFAGLFPLIIGIITVFSWLKCGKPPYDQSNRINNILLWWLATRKDERFLEIYPWLKGDVRDSLKD